MLLLNYWTAASSGRTLYLKGVPRTESFQYREERLILASRQGNIDERFKPTYEKLCSIRNHLEKLSITQAWSLRETDLYDYQRQLDRIDESRVNGNFEDSLGNKADLHAQRVSLTTHVPCTSDLSMGRPCFIWFDEVMPIYTPWSFRRSLCRKRCYPYLTNYKLCGDVCWRSNDLVESLHPGSSILIVWRWISFGT